MTAPRSPKVPDRHGDKLTAATDDERMCPTCGREPSAGRYANGARCLRAFVDGLRRRRAAEQRLMPLDRPEGGAAA